MITDLVHLRGTVLPGWKRKTLDVTDVTNQQGVDKII